MLNSEEPEMFPNRIKTESGQEECPEMKKTEQEKMKTVFLLAKDVYPELSASELEARAKDMIRCAEKYHISFWEYSNFHLYTVPEEERGFFITEYNRHQYYSRLNCAENKMLFKQKDLTYQRFYNYYKRDLRAFTKPEQQDEFYRFLEKHKRIIIKPLGGTFGKHIQVIEFALYPELLSEYKAGFVAEEIVRQSAEMAALNADSVNTVRMTTIRCDDHIEFLTPLLKCGRKGCCVDNASSGGIACELDYETGTVVRATFKTGDTLTCHPDSGLPLIGFQVPCWKEAIEFTEKLCSVVPENRYTGWDIALTDDGWVMIEGNPGGGFLMQIVKRKGVKPQMDAILEQIEHPISEKS